LFFAFLLKILTDLSDKPAFRSMPMEIISPHIAYLASGNIRWRKFALKLTPERSSVANVAEWSNRILCSSEKGFRTGFSNVRHLICRSVIC
jgi:hypothetical protein